MSLLKHRFPVAGALACALAFAATNTASAAATYKFVGAKLVTNNGQCITSNDKITMTLVFKSAIEQGSCNQDSPTSMTIGDGVNRTTFKPAFFGSSSFGLCKLNSGNKIDNWAIVAAPVSKSGSSPYYLELLNESGAVEDSIYDFLCSPAGNGSSGAAGKWTGP